MVGCFTDVAIYTVYSKVFQWLPPSLMFLMTSLFKSERKFSVFRKCKHLTQVVFDRTIADVQQVSLATELSLVAMWCHCLMLVYSKF